MGMVLVYTFKSSQYFGHLNERQRVHELAQFFCYSTNSESFGICVTVVKTKNADSL